MYKNRIYLWYNLILKMITSFIIFIILLYYFRLYFFAKPKPPIYGKGTLVLITLSILITLFIFYKRFFKKTHQTKYSSLLIKYSLLLIVFIGLIKLPDIDVNNGDCIKRAKPLPYRFNTALDIYWPGWELHTCRLESFALIYFNNKNVYTSNDDSFTQALNPSHLGNGYQRFILPKKVIIDSPYTINKNQKKWLESKELITFLTSNQQTVKFLFNNNWSQTADIMVVNDNNKNFYYIPSKNYEELKAIQ